MPPAKPPSAPAFPTGGREWVGPARPAAPGKIPCGRTPLRIHCLREDFLDYFPLPLPVDLDPAQCTVKSSAPLRGRAPPLPKTSPQEQGQQGLGLPVLREALLPGSFVLSPHLRTPAPEVPIIQLGRGSKQCLPAV